MLPDRDYHSITSPHIPPNSNSNNIVIHVIFLAYLSLHLLGIYQKGHIVSTPLKLRNDINRWWRNTHDNGLWLDEGM